MRVVLATAFALACVAIPPQASARDIVARMDNIVQSYVDDKQFMGSVLVARDGRVIFDKHYGYANAEWAAPNTADTKYRIASVTKQFTAAAILLLKDRGKLKVTDSLVTHIPDAPPAWRNITIHNLLTHTSGLADIPSLPDFKDYQLRGATFEQAVSRFKEQPLDFQPGEKMSYNNAGYVVLGYIIEKTSGQSYADFIQQNIFAPLGMKDSGYDTRFAIIPRRASGYVPTTGGLKNAAYVDMSIAASAGALYSTTHDLLLWERGLFGGKLLSAESLKAMISPFKGDYGFGVYVKQSEGRLMVNHSGGINGFNSQLNYYLDDKVTIAVLSNVSSNAPPQIASQLGSVFYGDTSVQPGERSEIPINPVLLTDYAGTYDLKDGVTLTVTVEGARLTMQAPGQGKAPMFAESETKFFLKGENSLVEFFRGEDNTVTRLVLFRGRHRTQYEGVKRSTAR